MRRMFPVVLGVTGVLVATSALADAPSPAAPPPAPPPALLATPAPAPPTFALRVEAAPHGALGDAGYRSPGLAALLSLTPLPVDFGNFYAENTSWALGYTTGELLLMGGMMWIGSDHMCHRDAADCHDWSDSERNAMIGLAGAYVAVKIVAAVQADGAARELNARYRPPVWQPVLVPTTGGASLGLGATF